MNFFALSHAPPALAMNMASKTPVTVAPASMPPRAYGPRTKPTRIGITTAITPGSIISVNAAFVQISIHLVTSGFTPSFPSSRPGISLNCLLISFTILKAALPTLVIVRAPIKKGSIPPIKRPITTFGSVNTITKLCPMPLVMAWL